MQCKNTVVRAFDRTADMLSDACPVGHTDPKSVWARRRALRNMNAAQLAAFSKQALLIVEATWATHGIKSVRCACRACNTYRHH